MEHFNTIIEIGSFSIKTIIYSEIDGKPKIEGIGKSNTQGYDGNNILGFDEFVESIHKSIVQAEKQSNFIIKSSYILLSNKGIKIKKIKNSLNLEIANDNSNIQIVISGNIEEIKKSEKIFLNNGIKKFVILNVSAAFHSKYMLKAQKELSNDIENLIFKDNKIKIISNYDANVHSEKKIIKINLQNQMANKVNWTQSIKKLEDIGEKTIIEMGPNKVLSGLIKRISNNFDIISINNISDIK